MASLGDWGDLQKAATQSVRGDGSPRLHFRTSLPLPPSPPYSSLQPRIINDFSFGIKLLTLYLYFILYP
jgi:hypothetical protein